MRPLVLLLLLGGCGWNHLPHQSSDSLDGPLWDPYGIVPTAAGLYVPAPVSGHLFWVEPDGSSRRVGIRPGNLVSVQPVPGDRSAVAFLERFRCEPDDPRDARGVERPEDCPTDALVVTTDLALLTRGLVARQVEIPGQYDAVALSHDGREGLAWLDLAAGVAPHGVINLNSVLAVDFDTGTATEVAVGFAADRVLFTPDDTRAVVLSQSSVAMVDLTLDPPSTVVTFPLTLDPDTVVEPVGVDLTPDGRYALISVKGSGDLYVLDLDLHAVNLLSLPASPAAMYVDAGTDRTVLTYAGKAQLDVIDHQYFDQATVPLDEPMTRILPSDGFVVLYNDTAGHDVYRVDLETLDVVEYRLQNPAISVSVAPTGEYAVALTHAEPGDNVYDASPGMEILDLRPGHDDSYPYLLERPGVGAAFVADEGELRALVLQRDVDYLYQLDLYSLDATELDLPRPPLTVGTVPNGPFFITHDDGMGLITFLDPVTGEMTTASGFGWNGLLFELGLDDQEAP